MEISIDGNGEKLWRVHFSSPEDAMEFLLKACQEYGNTKNTTEQSLLFLNRCKNFLSKELPGAWRWGSVWLFASVESIIPHIMTLLEQHQISNINVSEIKCISNSKYYYATRELFDSF